MHRIILFSLIFLSGEILAVFIFLGLNHIFIKDANHKKYYKVIGLIKGALERFLLFLAFSFNIFMILAFSVQ